MVTSQIRMFQMLIWTLTKARFQLLHLHEAEGEEAEAVVAEGGAEVRAIKRSSKGVFKNLDMQQCSDYVQVPINVWHL